MQLFVNGIVEHARLNQLQMELIITEWNPPPDRQRLSQMLRWPSDNTHCRIRIIEVPGQIHHNFAYADRLPLFQMVGKNVGIRRAKGEYVLATNIDILFSLELFEFIAKKKLQINRMYRIDRHDVRSNVPADLSFPDQLEWCRANVISIYERERTIYVEDNTEDLIQAPTTVRSPLSRLVPSPLKRGPLYELYASHSRKKRTLHLNASGDFTLLSRRKWLEVRGYAELERFPVHLDSLLCYTAFHAGAKEDVLTEPMRIYHLQHSSGWDAQARAGRSTDERLDPMIVPQVTFEQLNEWAEKMRLERTPLILNDENWGLGDIVLGETSIG